MDKKNLTLELRENGNSESSFPLVFISIKKFILHSCSFSQRASSYYRQSPKTFGNVICEDLTGDAAGRQARTIVPISSRYRRFTEHEVREDEIYLQCVWILLRAHMLMPITHYVKLIAIVSDKQPRGELKLRYKSWSEKFWQSTS